MKQPLVMFICQTWLRSYVLITLGVHPRFRAGRVRWVWGLVLRDGLGTFPNCVAKGERIEEPEGSRCPTPVEIIIFIHGIPTESQNC